MAGLAQIRGRPAFALVAEERRRRPVVTFCAKCAADLARFDLWRFAGRDWGQPKSSHVFLLDEAGRPVAAGGADQWVRGVSAGIDVQPHVPALIAAVRASFAVAHISVFPYLATSRVPRGYFPARLKSMERHPAAVPRGGCSLLGAARLKRPRGYSCRNLLILLYLAGAIREVGRAQVGLAAALLEVVRKRLFDHLAASHQGGQRQPQPIAAQA